ncbi:MAG: hypothetical protein H7Z74_04980 [Anaerolineae bacterium]|nr:hypothetical protein [Gemmatimonadaceae bacterium]
MIARLHSQVPLKSFVVGARFLSSLPSFLRHPTSLSEARITLRRRLEQREHNFLGIAKRAVYQHAPSPYLRLLQLAGCEYGDLERLVNEEGVEGALHSLFRKGVYLTVNEFKGRRPATRGSATVEVSPELLRNPLAAFHIPARSGGSRSAGTPVLIDLAFVKGCGINSNLALDARGGSTWLKATWETPGAGARFRLLKYGSFGQPPVRWFSQVDPGAPGLDPIFRWSSIAMRLGSRLAGVPLPIAQYVPLNDPLPIAHWMTEVVHAGETPHVFTFPSSAVSLCQAASDAGIDLTGAQFTLAGEPTTEARLRTIRQTGAVVVARYGSMECGPIGYGCLTPETADDVHFLHDLHALIQPLALRGGHDGLPENAMFISSLHAASPFTLLNVSMGDQGTLVRRDCGCPLERLGWATHLHTIRSFEKLTSGGVTFLDADVIRVLEEELPARFGGAPTDYQLVEEEGADGRPRLRLLVHPRVGPLDTSAVADAFFTAISARSVIKRMMEVALREANLFQVERRAPLSTNAGKILHLHSGRSTNVHQPP